MDGKYTRLCDKIGVAATLEAMAEECFELGHACLKYSRYLRGENPIHGYDELKLKKQLIEELADVRLDINEVCKTGLVNESEVANTVDLKAKRMYDLIGVKA